ncbi:MAG TPA: tetratricopeptide repeat protein [Acidobacteriota bacterium]|nr:tetratricopeptide repeat protein [Acidobacteriota bacterium]
MFVVTAALLVTLYAVPVAAQDPAPSQEQPQSQEQPKSQEPQVQDPILIGTDRHTIPGAEFDRTRPFKIVEPEEILKLDDEMKAFVDQRVNRADPPLARLRRLVQVVFNRDALGFNYEWGASHTARETFHKGSGNCLSYTNMFLAMARYLDVDVRFHEVEIVPTWEKRGNMIYLSRHINVLAYIAGSAYEADLFPSISRHRIGGRVISDRRGLAHFYSNMGAELMSRDYYYSAIKYFKKALEMDGQTGFVWGNLGVAYSRIGDDERAEKAYLTALEYDKRNSTVMHNLARLYERQGEDELAAEYLEKVDKFRQRNPYFHYQLGMEALEAGQLHQAYDHFQDAIKRKKEEDLFYFALAKVHAQLGESNEVVKALETALQYATDGDDIERYNRKLQLLQALHASNH